MDPDTIDLTKVPEWHPEEWPCQGLVYPALREEPLVIQHTHSALLAIPMHYQALLPSPQLTVNQLFQFKLPSLTGDIMSFNAMSSFSSHAPTSSLTWLMDRSILPISFIEKVDQELGQKWFDGALSLLDEHMKGNEHLPLWIITWWKEMTKIIIGKGRWLQVDDWLSNSLISKGAMQLASVAKVDDARWLVRSLPWNSHQCPPVALQNLRINPKNVFNI
ncbi:hypothetical protein K439DRAFT_1612016 [Ramaria rubella]|nr:hypothetical protein K439DRAFT_1612016 [Ramaria rubella]